MRLSNNPDPHMRWIYDSTHPDYNSPQAIALRKARDLAILHAPQWMKDEAYWNDVNDSAQGSET